MSMYSMRSEKTIIYAFALKLVWGKVEIPACAGMMILLNKIPPQTMNCR